MPARWRRVATRSVRVVSYSGSASNDLLSLAAAQPIVAPTAWRPATDVCETPESVTVITELAGVQEDDIEIELYPDAVILDGFRPASSCGPDAVYHSLQIRHGSFHLEIALPVTVDVDRSEATFENGLLRIGLPKLDEADVSQPGLQETPEA